MKSRRHIIITAVVLANLAGVPLFATSTKTDEAAIRALDMAWSHATEIKDMDKAISFYAEDASVLPDHGPIVNGMAAIRAAWSQFMAMPGFSLRFTPNKIVISKSGDLAYDVGTFQMTLNDAQGKIVTTVGKYVVNWQKRGGDWKAVTDIFNDDK